jgi:hypothetical protein
MDRGERGEMAEGGLNGGEEGMIRDMVGEGEVRKRKKNGEME